MAYPYMFKHLLFSERGTQVQQNLANSDWEYYKEFLGQFKYTINRYVYMSRFHIVFNSFLVLVLVAVVCMLIRWKKGQSKPEEKMFVLKNGLFNFVIVGMLALGYFLILFKISYSANWIYISPVFALLVILTVGAFAIVLNRIVPKYYSYILFGFCAFWLINGNISSMEGSILGHEQTKIKHDQIVKYSEDCDVLFFYDEWNNLYDNQILELMQFEQIRAISLEEMTTSDYESILSARKEKNNLVLYISTEVEDYQEKINAVVEKIGAADITLISEESHAVYFAEFN